MDGLLITQPVTTLNELRDIVPAWDDLARHALESNVFYESWALIPALEQLVKTGGDVTVLLVWENTSHSRLIGLFPLIRERSYLKCPASHWTNWLHLHCPLGTPLVRQDHAAEAIRALLAWVQANSDAVAFSFNKIPAEGAFACQLRAVLDEQGRLIDEHDQWERAILQGGMKGEGYVLTHQRKKKLKEYARLRRRLEDCGELELEVLLPGESGDLSRWINEFMLLEQHGWKGRRMTAMYSHSAERVFAETLMHNAAQYGQLMMLKMTLDGEPIAIKLNLVGASQGAYAFKIAYDERYASYSPGVLLELENIYAMLDDTPLGWMDSCAIPDHPMINRLWAERRKMVNMHISTDRVLSKPLLHTMRLIKTTYDYYKGVRS